MKYNFKYFRYAMYNVCLNIIAEIKLNLGMYRLDRVVGGVFNGLPSELISDHIITYIRPSDFMVLGLSRGGLMPIDITLPKRYGLLSNSILFDTNIEISDVDVFVILKRFDLKENQSLCISILGQSFLIYREVNKICCRRVILSR